LSGLRTTSRALGAVVRGMRAHGALDAARLMAFNFFLSLVPLLVILGFAMGHFVRRRGVDALMGPLLDAVPSSSADMVRHELERMAGSAGASMAPVSAIIFLWLTSSGTHGMMDVFEAAARAPARPWWKQRAIALLAVFLAVFAMSMTAWGLLAADDVLHRHDPDVVAPASSSSAVVPAPSASAPTGRAPLKSARDPRAPVRQTKKHVLARMHDRWERIVAGGAMLVVGFLGLAGFYRYAVEHPPGIRRRAVPGAVTAVLAWLVVSWIFGDYVISLGSYALYYGSLAAVAVLLVWLYLTSLALLLGAEVNALLEGVGAHE
jgi:membrane protein